MFRRQIEPTSQSAARTHTSHSGHRKPLTTPTHSPTWTHALGSQPAVSLQPKLTVNQPGDQYEQEADHVANQVTQRQPATVHRKSDGIAHTEAPPSVHQTLRSSGQPLDSSTRSFMEPRFGQDFSNVRLHTGSQAAQSAADVQSRAYTVGNNIVFGSGQYAPHSPDGQQLLAHELTHTLQQNHGPSSGPLLQRDDASSSTSAKPLAPVFSAVNLPSTSAVLESGENPGADNPKIKQLAAAYKSASSSSAYIALKAYIASDLQYNTEKAKQEAARLRQALQTARSALESLGVPSDNIEIQWPENKYATNMAGQIQADVYTQRQALPSYSAPGSPAFTPAPKIPTSPASPSKSLSDMLTFKFKKGVFEAQIELPKSVTGKLKLPLGGVYSMDFELKGETSGDFSFGINFNGLRHIKVGLKAGFKVDKDKGSSGSLGLEITTTKTVCSAANPEALKAKILESGEKLKKALDELPGVESEKRLEKLIDIGSAIGDMYDSIDKSKQGCKEAPAATFNFGVQTPINPSDKALEETDPLKRPAPFIGGSITIPF